MFGRVGEWAETRLRRLRPTNPVPIVMGFDERFTGHAAVTMLSVLVNSRDRHSFVCISNGWTDDSRTLFRQLVLGYGSSIHCVDMDESAVAEWKVDQHFSIANYFRIFAAETVDAARALYLDNDTLVTCDITPLLDSDLGGCWLGGCYDRHGAATTRMPLADREQYINTGVLLMDLIALRAAGFRTRCAEVHGQYHDAVTYADQCIINKVAEHKVLLLDQRWNVQATAFRREDRAAEFSRRAGRSILHFSGPRKPWIAGTDPALAEMWSAYARKLTRPP